MVAAPPTPDQDATLLHDILAGDLSSIDIAAKHNIALPLLLDWLATPQTRTRIAAALDAEDAALHRKLQHARAKAIDTLTTLLDTTDDPIEARRAASALLRPLHRKPSIKPPDTPPPMRTLLGRITEPRADDSPQDIITRVLARLQHNDNPHENAGLEQLFASLSETARASLADTRHHPKAATDPHAFAQAHGHHHQLTNFTSAILHPMIHESKPLLGSQAHGEYKTARQNITFSYPDHCSRSFTFNLTLEQLEYHQAWRITHIAPAEDSS